MKYRWIDDGRANFYSILKGENWFAQVQLNGEMSTAQQKSIMNDLVKALN